MRKSVDSSFFKEKQIEYLAVQAHRIFCDGLLDRGHRYGSNSSDGMKTHPALVPYDHLSEEREQSNRRFIREIPRKLPAVGYTLDPKGEKDQVFEIPESVQEILAKMEHERWVQHMRQAGWAWGSNTDPGRKVHASMAEWSEFSAFERDKDRLMIGAIPRIVELAGYHIVRTVKNTIGMRHGKINKVGSSTAWC